MKKRRKLVRPPWTPERRRRFMTTVARKRKIDPPPPGDPPMSEKRIKARADERRKQTAARWTRDLQWKSKPPPPEECYIIYTINGRPTPIRCVLSHQHNMPIYLPMFDFPEPKS